MCIGLLLLSVLLCSFSHSVLHLLELLQSHGLERQNFRLTQNLQDGWKRFRALTGGAAATAASTNAGGYYGWTAGGTSVS